MAYVMIVVGVRTDSDTDLERLEDRILAALRLEGLQPTPCDWAPDLDTVTDLGFHAEFGDVTILDLNPPFPS